MIFTQPCRAPPSTLQGNNRPPRTAEMRLGQTPAMTPPSPTPHYHTTFTSPLHAPSSTRIPLPDQTRLSRAAPARPRLLRHGHRAGRLPRTETEGGEELEKRESPCVLSTVVVHGVLDVQREPPDPGRRPVLYANAGSAVDGSCGRLLGRAGVRVHARLELRIALEVGRGCHVVRFRVFAVSVVVTFSFSFSCVARLVVRSFFAGLLEVGGRTRP